jgi:hypothetical protein
MTWMTSALCVNKWTIFDGATRQAVSAAQSICAQCPVSSACHALAEERNPTAGVWAGRDYG